ncbi:MAG: carboxymuconolactone decarboxylase family protein [Tepidiformaceae bacterium]
MARIPLPTRESLPDELKERWDATAARGPVLNIQRAFLANPAIEVRAFQAWRASGLEPRARELVILRCAWLKQSRYEWHQHVRIARGEGLTDAEIDGVRDWKQSTLFSEAERTLLAYADELAGSPKPSDAAFEAFARGRSPADVFGVTYLITLYFQLAHIMAALDLETEDPFVGWEIGG